MAFLLVEQLAIEVAAGQVHAARVVVGVTGKLVTGLDQCVEILPHEHVADCRRLAHQPERGVVGTQDSEFIEDLRPNGGGGTWKVVKREGHHRLPFAPRHLASAQSVRQDLVQAQPGLHSARSVGDREGLQVLANCGCRLRRLVEELPMPELEDREREEFTRKRT